MLAYIIVTFLCIETGSTAVPSIGFTNLSNFDPPFCGFSGHITIGNVLYLCIPPYPHQQTGLITFSFFFGMAAGSLKEKGEPFHMFFESTRLITAEIFKYLFKITPIGVASLIMASVAGIKDISTLFTSLGMFSLTVLIGLACHMLVFMNLIYLIIFRKNPFKFFFTCIRPYILAFTFTSSSAAFPEMESSLVERNGADKRVVGVSLPLVVTLNAGGSAVFIVTAAMFLANYQGVHLNAGNITVLVVLTAIVTMALPGVPSSSIVTLILLLTSMNINPKPVAMLYALEWL
ncbi:neutral amino acid transporter A-like, partial [Octopus sinensis]|uniref:Amino acid transporter n=1 Tax=Octopus sinensis TaxID=2607531 RepID=A0A6P7U2J3_9MOLL